MCWLSPATTSSPRPRAAPRGTMEPAEGSVEAEAFRRITEYGRHDFVRVHEARERDHSYARFQEAVPWEPDYRWADQSRGGAHRQWQTTHCH
jgi:hypothetical protein